MDINLNSVTGIPDYSNNSNNFNNLLFNEKMPNPIIITIIVIVLLLYFGLFSSLGGVQTSSSLNSESGSNSSSNLMEVLLWSLFIVLILMNGMSYIFNLNITASIKNLFNKVPDIDIVVHPNNIIGEQNGSQPQPPQKKPEVFHVSNNKYDYENAKAVCSAYGSRLATIKELDAAYDDGGDWCSFGWSEDQMALYPTQYEHWEKLQKIKGHEHDCGRPGINGGYIANPNVRFGVNCYGMKPDINSSEIKNMGVDTIYPKDQKEIDFDKRVDYWRTKLPDIAIAPFNHDTWSII
jgi:hypothetical protein